MENTYYVPTYMKCRNCFMNITCTVFKNKVAKMYLFFSIVFLGTVTLSHCLSVCHYVGLYVTKSGYLSRLILFSINQSILVNN